MKTKRLVLSCVCCGCVLVGISVGTASGDSSSAAPAQPVATPQQAFAAFARGHGAQDTLPAGAEDELTRGGAARFGLDPKQSRLVNRTGNVRTFLVVNADYACIVKSTDDRSHRSVGCGDAQSVLTGPVVYVEPRGEDGYRISGVAPDYLSRVTLHTESGETLQVGVTGNVFAQDITGTRPGELTYADSGRNEHATVLSTAIPTR
jgi:hypothetical protein